MAENVQDIKRRIKSVNSTMQITHAMELVASAKLRKSRELAEGRRPYFEAMIESIGRIVEKSGNARNIFMDQREVKKTAYIIITGDKGLAGGYNVNVAKLVEEHITDKENAVLFTVGSRGRDHFRNREYHIQGEYLGISERPNFFNAKEVTAIVMEGFKNGEYDEVYIAYTKFVSTITQHAQMMKLLPLSAEELITSGKVKTTEETKEEKSKMSDRELTIMTYEPEPEELLKYLIPNFVSSTVYGSMIESAASEQGARRTAMESATTNANEMIDGLTLQYNRVRQAAITQEISEIVGGAEALN
ncbi:ATP synthase F1 subunit gamma [Acetobacterium woodii]|uniref:ATP synthase gamma chain, sodium ion specific n=1 Tax=Acetobacterium woodii (strain ATCC 29683 / DSM 1030 / JCM 2381 / KCTC 1655 / WB1) TaxID=931626 RepID=ATPG_ACEWD|nr:ATP synthase F1 subunit gamma [Acetobacterium woodii]P50005.3 RecName: Full=ATP synthase gamma chain, sodium ion specific; AltName: Full=F-ATPase gamma subunit, sodium ion specific; AltName: Full=Na(+)-translocating ATPase gamma chain [Acetobacterium woodii DSM 1030]AFA47031.1 F-type ATP synthase subunit G [Acetobacterium woodii DSM 1030]